VAAGISNVRLRGPVDSSLFLSPYAPVSEYYPSILATSNKREAGHGKCRGVSNCVGVEFRSIVRRGSRGVG